MARAVAAYRRRRARRLQIAELDLLLGSDDSAFPDVGTTRDEVRARRAALRSGGMPT